MTARADTLDLATLRLASGEARRLEVAVGMQPLTFGGERYTVAPSPLPVALDVSRTTGAGYALRLRLQATIEGPCARCLEPASLTIDVDAREVSIPGGGEELESEYVERQVLNVAGWARDALALALPPVVLCREQCAGLCAVCGANLNEAGPEHRHEPAPDPRWAKLAELELTERADG